MADPTGIANWSVTHVDWSEGKWHPKVYRAVDTSFELLKNISVSLLEPSDRERERESEKQFVAFGV
jgi:hypothetical protein